VTAQIRKRLAIFFVLAIVAVAYTGARYAQLTDKLPGQTYTVVVDLERSGGAFDGAEVTYRGVPIGRVTDVALSEDGVVAELTIRASLDNLGAGHDNIDFVEMPFPDMLPALEEGRIDAVHVIEPFMSIGLQQDMRSVLIPYNQTQPGLAIGSYFSSEQYIAENPEVIERFTAGVEAGSQYIADNPDEFRAALPDLADLEPEVAEIVNVPDWGGPVDVESVELIAQRMEEFDIIGEAPPLEEVVHSP
jgi:NitT/TauT family transport system substrate-binding protein